MKRLLLLLTIIVCTHVAFAQLLTWSPSFPKETDGLEITVDVSKGNQGLMNFSGPVFVHIGVITNKSSNGDDWKYVPFQWGTSPANGAAVSLGNNKWKFTITGSLRAFFAITDATETIQKVAILFRNASGDRAQRNTDGSNMYVPIYPANAFAVRLSQPAREPKFIPTPETQAWSVGTGFTIGADASKPSAMKLYHNGTQIAASSGNVTTLSGNATVTAAGNQQIVAEATEGGTTTYDTINIFVGGTAPVAALPAGVRDGINYNANNTSVTLVLRAPGKNLVTVIGDFNNWTQSTEAIMNKTPDGKFFWITINGLTAGAEYAYQYLVDGNLRIADPYTEKILDPSSDPFIPAATYPNLKPYPTGKTSGIVSVLQTAQPTYTWAVNNFNRPDKRGLVIYELLLRDFVAAHDWKTLRDTLSYLKRLGINAIEVMPFNEFEGNLSWGYNGFQYFAPDKYYGTKNALKEFIDTCHKAGIAVIMDVVLNHTYGPSPLARLYWDATNNRPAANNPWYNPVQPHAFGFGDDFNHQSTDTRDFFNRVLQHWVSEYKIDGYRVDFSKGLTQRASTDDAQFSAYDASRIGYLKGYYDAVKVVDPTAYFILEHFCDNNEEKELADYGMLLWGNLNDSYAQAAMGHTDRWDFSRGISSTRGWTNPHLVTYAESHDEERIMYKNLNFGNSGSGYNVKDTTTALKRAELTAAFLLTIPGPKMIWQFGELGYHYSINTCPDGTVNNNCRVDNKPIRWDFLADPRRVSLYNTYSRLINLRFHPWYTGAFQTGTVERNLGNAFKWIKLTTTNDTSDLVVMGNFGISLLSGSFTFPAAGTWYNVFDNTTFAATGGEQSFTLNPGEYRVFVNRNVNNITTTPVSNVPWNETSFAAGLFPNPVRSNYTLEVAVPQSGNLSVSLYNSMGQFVSTVYQGFILKGQRQIPLKRPAVSTGSYFLRVQIKGENKTIPFTLQ